MFQLSCARGELRKKTQKKAFARAELLTDAAMPLRMTQRDTSGLPRIVWGSILSRGPENEVQRRELAKERRTCVRARLGPSDVHLWSEGGRASKLLEGTQLLRPQQMIRDRRQERPRGHRKSPSLPALENPASPGKRAIKTIRVDLRPLLEKAVEPSGSRQGDTSEGVPRGDGWPSSSRERSRGRDLRGGRAGGVLGGRRGDVGGRAGDQVDGKDGGPVDGEKLTHGRANWTIMRTPIPAKAEGPRRDTPWQAKGTSSEMLGLETKDSEATKGILPQLPGNSRLPATMLQPRLDSPVSLPSVFPKLRSPAEAESSTGRPAASSPDVQIPTRLLLRWLQETTTSKNHRLIAEILSTLREELLVGGPKAGQPGEKRNPCLDLPQIGPRRSGPLGARYRERDATCAERKKKPNTFPGKVC